MIIAIDGPAASGKSTAARRLAATLGLLFLDTGAMYRAATHQVLAEGLDPGDVAACTLAAARLRFELEGGRRLIAHGPSGPIPEAALRGDEVTRHVSQVAAHPPLRRVLVKHQQGIGRQAREAGSGLVLEGRDTTTVVFPDAEHKFYLVATPRERARRRALELGDTSRIEEIERDILRRDTYDSTRADSPLRQHPDAVALITDGLDPDAVLAALLAVVQPEGSAR